MSRRRPVTLLDVLLYQMEQEEARLEAQLMDSRKAAAMGSGEELSAYCCPHGLDPKRWCDVELRKPDMWGDLRCGRCGWQGKDIPQERRYGPDAWKLPHFGEHEQKASGGDV